MTGEKVELDGHLVDADKLDQFHNGSDGSRVTDEEWDESKARKEFAESLTPEQEAALLEQYTFTEPVVIEVEPPGETT
jgi:hypothetical protein